VTRWSGRVAILAVALAIIPCEAAQAQRVRLEVRPRPGDTLHVLLNHAVTVTIPAGPRSVGDSATTYAMSYRISTRDVVERADINGTIIHAIVDSVRMQTSGSIGASPFPGVDRNLDGMKVRLHVLPDGSARVIEGIEQLDPELRGIFGAMPAVLPATPVGVRESWTRDLPLPAMGAPAGATAAGDGLIRVTFRLDSLTSNGDLAWISLRGQVIPPPSPPGSRAREPDFSGSFTGELRLDRHRGWLAESSATVTVESLVSLPGGDPPFKVRVRLHQVMKTAPARR
jgi:hypothetical protein